MTIDQAVVDKWGAKYVVFQLERGEKTGTKHLEGYIEMPKTVRFSHFKELKGAHFEACRGTPEQCRDYCTKEETRLEGPWEFGTFTGAQPGKRNDLLALRDAVKSGKRGRELYDDDEVAGAAIKHGRGVADLIKSYSEPTSRDDIRVYLHFGPAGTGKSTCAATEGAYYYDGNAGDFWIGYTGQKVCIIDDFKGNKIAPAILQRVADKFPMWVPIKGGEVPVNSMFLNPLTWVSF